VTGFEGEGIPFLSDALLYLNGTITEDSGTYYLVDQSGNSRDFKITGYDWADRAVNNQGFPYKTAATISAPIGDAILIAADINNFLYDSGGTPNKIPVVSFFQDIDYENKLFNKHSNQVLDVITGVETSEPFVSEIVLYDTVKTSAELTECQTYYVVPTEDVNYKWVTESGTGTGTGTKVDPYRYLSEIGSGEAAYVQSGIYKEPTFLTLNKAAEAVGIGFCTLQSTSTSYVIQSTADSHLYELHNLVIDGEGDTLAIIYNADTTSNKKYNKCLFKDASTYGFWLGSNVDIEIKNSVILKRIQLLDGLMLDACYYSAGFQLTGSGSGSGDLLIKHSIIKDRIIINYAINDISIFDNIFIEDSASTMIDIYTPSNSCVVHYNTTTKSGGGRSISTQMDISIHHNTINSLNNTAGFATIDIDNTSDCDIYNNIITGEGANNFAEISVDTSNSISNTVNIYNNAINHKSLAGYGIRVGKDTITTTDLCSPNIYGNKILSGTYFDSGAPPSTSGTHGIFIGGLESAVIKWNYVNGGSPGIAIKGDGNQDGTAIKIYYNICKDNYANYFILGVDNIKLYNCASIQEKEINRHFNFGDVSIVTTGGILKNCIATGDSISTALLVIGVGSESGFESNYNNYYIPNNESCIVTDIANSDTIAKWQALGYDTNTIISNPDVNDYGLPISPIFGGEALGNDYRTRLNETTDWGSDSELPTIVTRLQGKNWDMGAYIHDPEKTILGLDFNESQNSQYLHLIT